MQPTTDQEKTISETMDQHDCPKSFEPFYLTCLDHTVGPVFMNFFLSFRCETNEECLLSLTKGVARVITRLPFLAGEVVLCPSTPDGRINVMQIRPSPTLINEIPLLRTEHHPDEILPNTPLQSKAADAGVSGGFASLDESYVPQVALLPLSPDPRPVVRFQANVLADGIVLAVGFHHSVFDATGAGRLIEILAECCRGSFSQALTSDNELEEEIRLRRLVDSSGDIATVQPSQHVVQDSNASESAPGNSEWIPPSLSIYSFNFSKASIAAFKTACNKALPSILLGETGDADDVATEFVSSNDVLTALLASSIHQARSHSITESEFVMIVNVREKLLSLPSSYMGNAVIVLRALARSQDTPEPHNRDPKQQYHPEIANPLIEDFTKLALHLRTKLSTINDASIRENLSHLWQNPNWSQLGTQLPSTMISSWRHLKVYRVDFGESLGRVVEFQPQTAMVDGICMVQPERVDGVGWEVCVTLKPEVMERFIRDGVFASLAEGRVRRL